LLLLIINLSVSAKYNNVYFPFLKNFERSEYHAGMQTWMITQANNGLLYFANNNGLLEFDGHNWELYGLNIYTIVRSVLAASDGKIYVGLSNNFGYFETDSTGRLSFYSMLDLLPPDKRNIEEIWRIHNSADGIIFQSFKNFIVVKNNKASIYDAPSKFHYSFPINNKIYVIDKETGVLEFINGQFKALPGTEALAQYEICSLQPYGKDLMISTMENGVFIYKNKKLTEWQTPASDFLKKNQIYCVLRIDENKIAFGTIQKGLLITDSNGIPQIAMDKTKGLQNNTVLSLKLDKSGNLWIGTDNGIDLLYVNSPISQLSLNQGIGSGYTAIIHNNKLYLGTNQGLFYKQCDNSTGFNGSFDGFKLVRNTKGQVWHLQVIDNQLFCGHNKGTFIIKGAEAELLTNISGTWTFLHSENRPNTIIAGTYDGLILLNKIAGVWKFKQRIGDFQESSRMMHFDADENIWMSHGFKGVYHLFLNQEADSITHIQLYNSKNGFKTDFGVNVTSLQDQIVFLSSEGAFVYNKELDTMMPSNYFNELFGQLKVNNAIEDRYGNIWYYQDFSLAVKLIKADGKYRDISMPFKQLQGDFIEGFQFIFPIDSNNYLISYDNGFVHYSPFKANNQETPFSHYISRVKLSKADSLIFTGHLFTSNTVIPTIDYKNNNIQFVFSAVNYENPDKVEFTTLLEGHDKTWTKWERRYDREYTNLKEGSYTFMLKARNIYKNETEILRYKFEIAPPWKRTKAAYFFYVLTSLFLLGVVTLLIIKRMNFLKKREERLQREKFLEREKELQQEALIAEKEIIRLRNDKLREKLKTKDKELANSTMQTIQRNEFLISLKQDMAKNNSDIINDVAKRQNKALVKKIDNEINNKKNWEVFEIYFMNVHEEFLTKLKHQYPQISPAELRLCACLRMNISSKEIASLLNISLRGVEASRFRLRKALNLNREINLTDFILSI
jgi:hypothetical protein